MKFLHLDLKAVGPFRDQRLELSAGNQGFHLILGENEAGKTSALRAISYLLFKFPAQGTDNFLHNLNDLRVGGALRRTDGDVLEIVRRRGNKNTLRGADDSTVVSDEKLDRFLGSVDLATFTNLFGINHSRLTAAAQEIRTGQGTVGELLFAAGTGLTGLRQGQQRLSKSIDDLYKPKGQNQKINQALIKLREQKDELKHMQLSSEEWQKHDAAKTEATRRVTELVDCIRVSRCEKERLARIRTAIPQVARWRFLRGEFERLGDVVRLRDDFGDQYRKANEALLKAESQIQAAKQRLEALHDSTIADETLRISLDSAHLIDELLRRLIVIESAIADRARLTLSLTELQHKAEESLRRLGRPADIRLAETSTLRLDEIAAIRLLANQFAGLLTSQDEAAKALAEEQETLEKLKRLRRELGEPRDVESLRQAVLQARKPGDLDEHHALAEAAFEKAQRKAQLAVRQLPVWTGELAQLVMLAIPLEPTVDQFEARMRDAANEWKLIEKSVATEAEAIRTLESQLRALDLSQNVPTEADLQQKRRRRDEGWALVRGAWLEELSDNAETAQFIAQYAPASSLADAFEQSVRQSDDVSDRLRREAKHVARKMEWITQGDQRREVYKTLLKKREEISREMTSCEAEWTKVIGALGLPSLTPAEMKAWLRKRGEIVQLSEAASDARRELDRIGTNRNGLRSLLDTAMLTLGETPADASAGFLAAIDRAAAVLERHGNDALERKSLDAQLLDSDRAIRRHQLRHGEAQHKLEEWKRQWALKIEKLGYEKDVTPTQVEVILYEIHTLHDTLGKLLSGTKQREEIDRVAQEFAADAADLCRQVAADLMDQPAARQVREMATRLHEAKQVEQGRLELQKQHARETKLLSAAEQQRIEAKARLDSLCQEAGCESHDELPAAERRSRERTRLDAELLICQDGLFVAGSGREIDEFAAMVERIPVGELDASTARLDEEILSLEEEHLKQRDVINTSDHELSRMNGGDDAAEMIENSQVVLAQLYDDVTRYATLRLAAEVLRLGIDRHREKNQGTVLERAGHLFAELTEGSFTRLEIDDENGSMVLKGVRPGGETLGVQAMSDGSHDQLYLALRIASLESWLQTHEPIPLIVDDVLLNFDDRRALSALRAFGELSRKTQVLFFTHHRHLAELAMADLPDDVAFLHELPGPRSRRL